MEVAAANWKYDDLHKDRPYHDGTFTRWSDKRTDGMPYHYRDGVSVWVAAEDHSPGDEFLSRESASPEAPA